MLRKSFKPFSINKPSTVLISICCQGVSHTEPKLMNDNDKTLMFPHVRNFVIIFQKQITHTHTHTQTHTRTKGLTSQVNQQLDKREQSSPPSPAGADDIPSKIHILDTWSDKYASLWWLTEAAKRYIIKISLSLRCVKSLKHAKNVARTPPRQHLCGSQPLAAATPPPFDVLTVEIFARVGRRSRSRSWCEIQSINVIEGSMRQLDGGWFARSQK